MLECVLRWNHVQHPTAWCETNKIPKIKIRKMKYSNGLEGRCATPSDGRNSLSLSSDSFEAVTASDRLPDTRIGCFYKSES